MNEEIRFHDFFAMIRRKSGATLSQVGEGIYSESMMNRIEKGKRVPDRLMRNRLLARLGLSIEGFEEYVQSEEFIKYELQIEIIRNIGQENYYSAAKNIKKLMEIVNKSQKIYIQFIYWIQAILEKEKNNKIECIKYSKLAVNETININKVLSNEVMLLSPQEHYYILFYIESLIENETELEKSYIILSKIIDRIELSTMDIYSKSKVYPMAVVVLYKCECKLLKKNIHIKQIWNYTEKALQILQESKRDFYLIDILKIRQTVRETDTNQKEKKLLDALQAVYNKYNIKQDNYLSVGMFPETVVYDIGNIIKQRRKIMGLSQVELAKGICDVKTIMRIENHKCSVRFETLNLIMKKLKLPSDFFVLPVVTDDEKVITIYEQLRYSLNHDSPDTQKEKLMKLKENIDSTKDNNKQILDFYIILHRYKSHEISIQKLYELLCQLIEQTLLIDNLKNKRVFYLTNTEMECIYNIARIEDYVDSSLKRGVKEVFLEYALRLNEEHQIRNAMDFMILMWLASYLGNNGKYQESNNISDNLGAWLLKSGRLPEIGHCLYNNIWNDSHYEELSLDYVNKILNICCSICDFYKDNNHLFFYNRKIEYVKKGDYRWYEH